MLEGRKILVTGGAAGIGRATAQLIRKRGGQAYTIDLVDSPSDMDFHSRANVTDYDQVDAAVREAADRMGGIDGLANVAGLGGGDLLEETDMARWHGLIDVNLTGPLNMARATIPYLRQAAEASIVNISSGVALHPMPRTGAYAAAKSGLIALSRTWAMELAPSIRVNALCPGPVVTTMLSMTNADPAELNRLRADNYALKRFARPEEIATGIAFLLGSDASFITGIVLPIDGGRTYY